AALSVGAGGGMGVVLGRVGGVGVGRGIVGGAEAGMLGQHQGVARRELLEEGPPGRHARRAVQEHDRLAAAVLVEAHGNVAHLVSGLLDAHERSQPLSRFWERSMSWPAPRASGRARMRDLRARRGAGVERVGYCSSTSRPLPISTRRSRDRNDMPSRFCDSARSDSTSASTLRTVMPPISTRSSFTGAAAIEPFAVLTRAV